MTPRSKLYLQLEPDQSGLGRLENLRPHPGTGQPVAASELHLTIIHIGKLERVFDSIRPHSQASDTVLLDHFTRLAQSLEELRLAAPRQLTADAWRYERFGQSGQSLVLRFHANPVLDQLHHDGLMLLTRCLADCGLSDVSGFMRSDANLRFALTLRPHVTLVKRSGGTDLPKFENSGSSVSFAFSPIVV